jgi:hypothetical protein
MKPINHPEPFAWDVSYRNRTERLARLIKLNAPEVIIERECRSVLKAIVRKHNSLWAILSWARHAFHSWRNLTWFGIQWRWYMQVRGWSKKRCETHFFGESAEEKEIEERKERNYV